MKPPMLLLVLLAALPLIAQEAQQPKPISNQPKTGNGNAPLPQEAVAKNAVISNDDVLRMVKAGLAPEVVAAKVRASKCQCDTSPAVLEQLKSAAVPDSVIVAMIESSATSAPSGPTIDIRNAKSVYLVNRSTDQKVFDNVSKKLREWGRWNLVEEPEHADVLLVVAEK